MGVLVISGITAVPLEWELSLLDSWLGTGSRISKLLPEFSAWITRIHEGLATTNATYPFMAYGTDWLAFAHIAIAIAFWGPIKDPVRNIWVIEFGLICSALIIPFALIFGPFRGIPLLWRLVDCSFGLIAFPMLWYIRKKIQALALAGQENDAR